MSGVNCILKNGYRGETVVYIYSFISPEMIKWCYEILGEPGRKLPAKWRINYITTNRIYIRGSDSLILFTLRWL